MFKCSIRKEKEKVNFATLRCIICFMTPQLDSKLIEKYPKILSKLGYTECSDGWYDVIDVLCNQIQSYIDHKVKYSEMSDEDKEALQVVAVQVKTKFGGLRFYSNGGDDITDGMIRMAEGISYRVCEYCAAKASKKNNLGWIHTACQSCFDGMVRRKIEHGES